ncbi:MAG: T9SS type A sorting domain-containing protein [Bacteroidetes bacterium]|nr:T9SS type A sorting domain-containing protein [Bacteroidota bacterium]
MEQLPSIIQTSDGGFVGAGFTNSTNGDVSGNHGIIDAWVVKLNNTGSLQWQKCIGGTEQDFAHSIQQTSDGGFILVGSTQSNDGDVSGLHEGANGGRDVWVVRLDNTGNIQWQKCLGGTGGEEAYSIQQTSDGGYVLGGYTNSNDGDVSGGHGGSDAWVVKLSAYGAIEWQKCMGGTGNDRATSVQQTTDGGYIVAGSTYSNDGDVSGNHGNSDAWAVKIDAVGNIEWQRCLGGSYVEDLNYSVKQNIDGSFIMAGTTRSNDGDVSENHGVMNGWIINLDALGNVQWQKCIGGSYLEGINSIELTSDGGTVVVGRASSNDGDVEGVQGGDDFWVVKLSNSGALQWQKCLGGTGSDQGYSIQQTSDEGYILSGWTQSNDVDVSGNHGGVFDVWVVKLGPDQIGIEEAKSDNITVCPNPVRSTLSIGFAPQTKPRSVELVDATGRMVMTQTLINPIPPENLDFGGIQPGLYFVRLCFADGTKAIAHVIKE